MNDLARIIGFDGQLIFDSLITAVNILILFACLSYFLFTPVRSVLDKRKNKIKKELDDADEKLKLAENMKQEYEKKLAEVKTEINNMLEAAKKNANILSNEIVEKAKSDAKVIVDRGHKEIELEKEKAIDQLKKEVVNISTLIATKLIKKNINENDADLLFKETLDQIGDTTWQS